MIKAIVFDCFGVLVRDGWLPFCEHYFGNDQKKMNEAHELNRRMNIGHLGFEDFIAELSDLALVDTKVARHEIASNPPNKELFSWIRNDLRHRYKIGLLSNAGADWLDDLFTPQNVALFDATVLSYEIGVTKPNPAAYEAIADRLNVGMSECLFIDDQPHYCDAARAVGMEAVYYQDNIMLRDSLKKYNIFPQKG